MLLFRPFPKHERRAECLKALKEVKLEPGELILWSLPLLPPHTHLHLPILSCVYACTQSRTHACRCVFAEQPRLCAPGGGL